MVFRIPNTNIRVYKQPRGYRGVWYPPKPKQSVKRVFGNWEKSIAAALEALFGKIGLTKEERCRVNAAWSEARKSGICHKKQAISHTKLDIRAGHGSTVVFFKKHPFQGKLRFMGRTTDDKVRGILSRKGQKRLLSDWHGTREEAFEHLRRKSISLKMDEPAISHRNGVEAIHQIYGLYRDGKEMSELFKLSADAWQAYARREQCKYKLWSANEVDTLMQLEAPASVLSLHRDVRFLAQRADVARFFILYKCGGLYADLDTLPNRDRFPKVPLGVCTMLARETMAMRFMHFEIEVVVAEKGNPAILEILEDMKVEMAEKSQMQYDNYGMWRFISNTTGPVAVGKTLEKICYQPHVTVFSMCRPLLDLEKVIELDETGRVTCNRCGLESYDVLPAISMSYRTLDPRPPPPLARPLPQPPPGGQRKWRRYTIKKPELPDAEVKQLRTYVRTFPFSHIGYQPLVHY